MSFFDYYPRDDGDPYDGDVLVSDADIEMAELVAEDRRIAKVRASGVCIHSMACGVSESGEIYYREQVGLKRGQMACREHTNGCNAVFATEDEWHAARMAH